jgi:KAP family P-loop domain
LEKSGVHLNNSQDRQPAQVGYNQPKLNINLLIMPSSLLFQQLNTIQNNFDLQPLLDLEKFKAFGVPYDRDVLAELDILLEPDGNRYKPIKKFFAGHLGCGKSTLLSECAYNQQDRYFTVFFSIADFSVFSKVDHTDILFAIGISMLTTAKHQGLEISSTIEDSLYRWFNDVVQFDKKTEEGAIVFDLTFLKLKLQRESETREEVRKKFEKKIEDLISKLNEIAAIVTDLAQKPVLVIIDDLDKISDPAIARSIYSYNLNALIAPRFSIIYTIPISFYRNIEGMAALKSSIADPVLLMPVLKLVPLDLRRAIPDNFTSPAIESLEQAIHLRLTDRFKQIIEPAVVRQIVLTSGGLLRELIRLVYRCFEVAKKRAYQDPNLTEMIIDKQILDEAIKKTRLEFQAPIGEKGYEILTKIHKSFKPIDPKDPEFLMLLHGTYILEYQNSDMWYDTHPIIEDLLRRQNLI